MLGKPIDAPNNSIFLRTHWKCDIKRNGNLRARQFYGESKKAASMIRKLALTYSSCVEHPVQKIFLAIAAHLDLRICGGDAYGAFTHIPGPYVLPFVSINNQFSGYYRHKFGKYIDMEKVPPVMRSIQGHP